jgi:hypothetical protein
MQYRCRCSRGKAGDVRERAGDVRGKAEDVRGKAGDVRGKAGKRRSRDVQGTAVKGVRARQPLILPHPPRLIILPLPILIPMLHLLPLLRQNHRRMQIRHEQAFFFLREHHRRMQEIHPMGMSNSVPAPRWAERAWLSLNVV